MSFFNIMSLQLKGPLTLNSQGKSVLIGKGQPGPPPTQICFRSGSGKRAPFCTNPRRFRASCEFCDDSKILHLKKMSRMAKNRKSARDFKAKKASKARALRNDVQRNRARFLKAANILKEIVRINSKLADDIRIAQNNLTFLEIEEIIRNWDQHSELSPDSLLNPNQTHSVPIGTSHGYEGHKYKSNQQKPQCFASPNFRIRKRKFSSSLANFCWKEKWIAMHFVN